MISKIVELEVGLPFTVPIQFLKAESPDDFYYNDKSKELSEAVYLRALGLGCLAKIVYE
jgi:hypothetical protein